VALDLLNLLGEGTIGSLLRSLQLLCVLFSPVTFLFGFGSVSFCQSLPEFIWHFELTRLLLFCSIISFSSIRRGSLSSGSALLIHTLSPGVHLLSKLLAKLLHLLGEGVLVPLTFLCLLLPDLMTNHVVKVLFLELGSKGLEEVGLAKLLDEIKGCEWFLGILLGLERAFRRPFEGWAIVERERVTMSLLGLVE